MYNLPVIELRETLKNGRYLYEAIEDGKIVATRTAVRKYAAALINNSKVIANGVGRLDLLPGAIKQSHGIRAIAILKQA